MRRSRGAWCRAMRHAGVPDLRLVPAHCGTLGTMPRSRPQESGQASLIGARRPSKRIEGRAVAFPRRRRRVPECRSAGVPECRSAGPSSHASSLWRRARDGQGHAPSGWRYAPSLTVAARGAPRAAIGTMPQSGLIPPLQSSDPTPAVGNRVSGVAAAATGEARLPDTPVSQNFRGTVSGERPRLPSQTRASQDYSYEPAKRPNGLLDRHGCAGPIALLIRPRARQTARLPALTRLCPI
jgi:hypothetical protein